MRSILRWSKRHKVWAGIIVGIIVLFTLPNLLALMGFNVLRVAELFGIGLGLLFIPWFIFRKRNVKKRQNDDSEALGGKG